MNEAQNEQLPPAETDYQQYSSYEEQSHEEKKPMPKEVEVAIYSPDVIALIVSLPFALISMSIKAAIKSGDAGNGAYVSSDLVAGLGIWTTLLSMIVAGGLLAFLLVLKFSTNFYAIFGICEITFTWTWWFITLILDGNSLTYASYTNLGGADVAFDVLNWIIWTAVGGLIFFRYVQTYF